MICTKCGKGELQELTGTALTFCPLCSSKLINTQVWDSKTDKEKKDEMEYLLDTSPQKLPDWEYMLKSCIYTSLLGYRESSGYSIPCKTREEIEDAIVGKFKKRLKEGNYDIAKPYLPYRLIELEACLGQALAVLSELKENTRYVTWGENETHFEDTDGWAVLCDTVKKAKLLLNPDKENKV